MSYIKKVTHGAVYLYADTIVAMISGYIFWLVLSRLTTPDVIGTAGAVLSFSTIIATVINLGVPISVQRFLGKTFLNQRYSEAFEYISAAVVLLLIMVLLTSSAFFIFGGALMDLGGINSNVQLLYIVIALIISSAFGRLLRGIIIASLKTRILVLATVAATVSKFTISILLIFLDTGSIGLILGLTSFFVIESAVMVIGVFILVNRYHRGWLWKGHIRKIKQVLEGGIPTWIPSLITAFGTQLGTLLVFGWQGADEAGFYYIAFSVYSALAAVINVIFSITFPVLSAMDSYHQGLSWTVIKFSLILSLPFSFTLFFYPDQILSLFGQQYRDASSTLIVLIMSIVPITIIGGITNLFYARGNYRQALMIGITTSLPRTVIYFILVPIYGGLGSAIAFTLGSIAGLGIALILSKGSGMRIKWKEVCVISSIAIAIPFLFSLAPISYLIGIPLSIVTVYIVFFSFGLPPRSELTKTLSVMPSPVRVPIMKVYDIFNKDHTH